MAKATKTAEESAKSKAKADNTASTENDVTEKKTASAADFF